jgi:hypothetical protein
MTAARMVARLAGPLPEPCLGMAGYFSFRSAGQPVGVSTFLSIFP